MQTVELNHDYAASPDALWETATDWASVQAAMRGLVRFHGLPDAPLETGQVINSEFSLFGFFPRSPWVMEVLEYDPGRRVLRSFEHGGPVKAWRHSLHVFPYEGGARLSETIEVDAGAMTPLYAAWAGFMYRWRHGRRKAMLARR